MTALHYIVERASACGRKTPNAEVSPPPAILWIASWYGEKKKKIFFSDAEACAEVPKKENHFFVEIQYKK